MDLLLPLSTVLCFSLVRQLLLLFFGSLLQLCCPQVVIDGLTGLGECKTKDKWTEVSRAEELTKEVNNWYLSYQTKVRGDSPSL